MQKNHLDSNEALAEDHAESNGQLQKNQQNPVNIIRIYIYIIVYIHADAAQNASESNETLIRNHQDLMQSEGHQTFTDFH